MLVEYRNITKESELSVSQVSKFKSFRIEQPENRLIRIRKLQSNLKSQAHRLLKIANQDIVKVCVNSPKKGNKTQAKSQDKRTRSGQINTIDTSNVTDSSEKAEFLGFQQNEKVSVPSDCNDESENRTTHSGQTNTDGSVNIQQSNSNENANTDTSITTDSSEQTVGTQQTENVLVQANCQREIAELSNIDALISGLLQDTDLVSYDASSPGLLQDTDLLSPSEVGCIMKEIEFQATEHVNNSIEIVEIDEEDHDDDIIFKSATPMPMLLMEMECFMPIKNESVNLGCAERLEMTNTVLENSAGQDVNTYDLVAGTIKFVKETSNTNVSYFQYFECISF